MVAVVDAAVIALDVVDAAVVAAAAVAADPAVDGAAAGAAAKLWHPVGAYRRMGEGDEQRGLHIP
jgi:hypothetical protein